MAEAEPVGFVFWSWELCEVDVSLGGGAVSDMDASFIIPGNMFHTMASFIFIFQNEVNMSCILCQPAKI
jgi:hypothetical protein